MPLVMNHSPFHAKDIALVGKETFQMPDCPFAPASHPQIAYMVNNERIGTSVAALDLFFFERKDTDRAPFLLPKKENTS